MSAGLVVITGASSGIGAKIAKDFYEKGHPLLLLARRVERLKALNFDESRVLCLKCDVTDRKNVEEAVATAEKKFGSVSILVNNAGVMLLETLQDQDPEEWETMINVNVFGVLNGIKAVIKGMISRKDGFIVNISSIAGQKLFDNHTVYCASKFAVHAITEGLRREAAPHSVRVVLISPGAVETELLSHTTSDSVKSGYNDWKKTMTEGVLLPQDVSDAVMFATSMPKRCTVREITLAPTNQIP